MTPEQLAEQYEAKQQAFAEWLFEQGTAIKKSWAVGKTPEEKDKMRTRLKKISERRRGL